MSEALIGKAPLTVVRMDDGRRVHVARGTLVPTGVDLDDAERLYDEGYLDVIALDEDEVTGPVDEDTPPVVTIEIDAQTATVPDGPNALDEVLHQDQSTEATEDQGPAPVDVSAILKGSVDEVLDRVGDDADLAAQVLAAEQAKSRPRVGVIEGLQEAITAAAGGE